MDLWAPPIFDIDGLRIALTFDIQRDIDVLPQGCDLVIHFQADAFDMSRPSTTAAGSLADGTFSQAAASRGIWLACMAPIGGFDEAVYTGGSFVLDDSGRLVALSPSFEEDLLVCNVDRGLSPESATSHIFPVFNREEWLWGALQLHLRDHVHSMGRTGIVVELAGDLTSSLLAALAVDALGSRNVAGVVIERPDVYTAKQEARETERRERARLVARALHMRLLERSLPDPSISIGRDAAPFDQAHLLDGMRAILVDDVARQAGYLALSPLTKTEIALCADGVAPSSSLTGLCPFGDVYLTEIEFLARHRNRLSIVLPQDLVCLDAIERIKDRTIARIMDECRLDAALASKVVGALADLDASRIDGVLEAFIDGNRAFHDIPLAATRPGSVALIMMLVGMGEAHRRVLPPYPIVSPRSLAERAWPMQLAWSDTGVAAADSKTPHDLALEEVARIDRHGDERGARVREEIMGLLGDMLGLSPEQRSELLSPEGQRQLQEGMQRFEDQLKEAMGRLSREDPPGSDGDGRAPTGPAGMVQGFHPGEVPFFSIN